MLQSGSSYSDKFAFKIYRVADTEPRATSGPIAKALSWPQSFARETGRRGSASQNVISRTRPIGLRYPEASRRNSANRRGFRVASQGGRHACFERWHFANSLVATGAAAGLLALMLCVAQAQDKTSGTAARRFSAA